MNIRLLFGLLFALVSMPYLVSGQDSYSFSLEEAQSYAKENSYVLKNSRVDIAKAQKKVWETISIGLPQISGSASYMNFLDLTVSLLPAEFFGGAPGTYMPVKFGQDFSSEVGIKVDQLIFDGSYIVGVRSAKIYLQLSQQASEKTELDILNLVSQSYYAVLVAKETMIFMEENLENSQKLLFDTKALFENGFVEEQDVDQMLLQVKINENNILKTEKELRIAKTVLKYMVGIDIDKSIIVTDNLNSHVEPLVTDAPNFGGFDYFSHIDYRMAETNKAVSEKLLRLEKAAYLPRLAGFYNLSTTTYGNDANLYKSDGSWFYSSFIGLQLNIPIFSSGMKNAKVKQAKLELEKKSNDQELARQTLQKDYFTAIADLENAKLQYRNDFENKELAKSIFNKVTIKYNNGISSSIELAQVENQYISSQVAYVFAMMKILDAKVKLDKAKGEY